MAEGDGARSKTAAPRLRGGATDALPASPASIVAGLVLALVTLALFGVLAEDVYERETIRLDTGVGEFLHQYSTPALDAAMNAATFLGSLPALLPVMLGTGLLLLSLGRRRELLFLAVVGAGGTGLNQLLKAVFQRPRPALPWSLPEPSFSFPSGHAMDAFFCYLGVACVVWMVWGWKWGGLAVVAAVALVLAIGVSRVYLGYHYVSDVVGGYAAALCWLSGTFAAFTGWRHRARRQPLPQ